MTVHKIEPFRATLGLRDPVCRLCHAPLTDEEYRRGMYECNQCYDRDKAEYDERNAR